MKIQYNGSSKILKRLVELVNRSQNVALRQDNTDKNTLYWTGLDGVEITVNIPSGAVEVDTELSETSTNPVENQAITKELAQKADKSAIPTVGDGVLSLQRNGKSVGTFSANAEENASIDIPVPEKVSELENDARNIHQAHHRNPQERPCKRCAGKSGEGRHGTAKASGHFREG